MVQKTHKYPKLEYPKPQTSQTTNFSKIETSQTPNIVILNITEKPTYVDFFTKEGKKERKVGEISFLFFLKDS